MKASVTDAVAPGVLYSPKGTWLRSPLVYTLSLSIYCTAWTFYGAVGFAAGVVPVDPPNATILTIKGTLGAVTASDGTFGKLVTSASLTAAFALCRATSSTACCASSSMPRCSH